jgi:DNA repair protein RadC
MNLKTLPAQERPRERLSRYGADALSTVELLAILLGSGTKNCSVLELAQKLLGHFGSLKNLSEATVQELTAVKGIGVAKALQLQAVFAAVDRIETQEVGYKLEKPEQIFKLIRSELSFQKVEVLMVLLQDVKKRLIHREILSKGTLTELIFHPREIFHMAIRHCAYSIVIAHNHPSGDPAPSIRDIEMTGILAKAGRVVGIELSDHIIVGKDSYVSLRQRQLMD